MNAHTIPRRRFEAATEAREWRLTADQWRGRADLPPLTVDRLDGSQFSWRFLAAASVLAFAGGLVLTMLAFGG